MTPQEAYALISQDSNAVLVDVRSRAELELALAARTVAGAYSRYWEPYLAISALYLALTMLLSLAARKLEAPSHLRGR